MEDVKPCLGTVVHVSRFSLYRPMTTDRFFSTVLTMFQIPDAAGDPLTRWSALLALIFSIMSLTYGCIYIVQFNSMRSMYKASRWAEVRGTIPASYQY